MCTQKNLTFLTIGKELYVLSDNKNCVSKHSTQHSLKFKIQEKYSFDMNNIFEGFSSFCFKYMYKWYKWLILKWKTTLGYVHIKK
jgi:hypothetical protein